LRGKGTGEKLDNQGTGLVEVRLSASGYQKSKGVRTKKGAAASFFNVAGSIELKLK